MWMSSVTLDIPKLWNYTTKDWPLAKRWCPSLPSLLPMLLLLCFHGVRSTKIHELGLAGVADSEKIHGTKNANHELGKKAKNIKMWRAFGIAWHPGISEAPHVWKFPCLHTVCHIGPGSDSAWHTPFLWEVNMGCITHVCKNACVTDTRHMLHLEWLEIQEMEKTSSDQTQYKMLLSSYPKRQSNLLEVKMH